MPLPAPPVPIVVPIPADPGASIDFSPLPCTPGVFALEEQSGATLTLAITANLRRMVAGRLQTTTEDGPSRRIDYRSLTRTIRAMTVGSAFEAEWAHLQLARLRLTSLYGSLLDRWRGWFIHVNPDADFPRFVKTSRPTVRTGVHLGPVQDKHAAQRLIELLQDTFDLCRYYHILVEAPGATACAYKEMGKCPAPCDGAISMTHYRRMIRDAADFAARPDEARAALESRMQAAAKELDFEQAAAMKEKFGATAAFAQPAFTHVDRLDRFRYVAVQPGERPEHGRLMLISGGWIEPFLDIPLTLAGRDLDAAMSAVDARMHALPVDTSEHGVQNIGLVCRHLFPGQRRKSSTPGGFLPWRDGLDGRKLRQALRRLSRSDASVERLRDRALEAPSSTGD